MVREDAFSRGETRFNVLMRNVSSCARELFPRTGAYLRVRIYSRSKFARKSDKLAREASTFSQRARSGFCKKGTRNGEKELS